MDTPSTPPLEELLTHARWARALARQLLRDEQRADDVVQEAWLAAVERPPRPGPGLRAWFARLIRNLATNQQRAELRRSLHERGAATPEVAPPASPAPIVDEFASQQLVAQALLALDEPYRETLLRRWYRDEKPAAIARAMQVPVKTVDTRLARGLERLRAELTARRGGTSREWCVMLAPLAQMGTATGVVAAWTGGALTMSGLLKLTAAAAVVATSVATWSVVEARHGDGAKGPPVPPVTVAQDGEIARAPAEGSVGATRAKESPAAPASPTAADDPLAKWRGDGHLRGRVVDETSGKPIAGCAVTAWWGNGINLGPPWLAEVTTDAKGEFALEQLGTAIGVSLLAEGHVKHFENFRDSDLHDDRSAAPRLFRIEPRTYGTLVVRLHARNGQVLSRSIAEHAFVVFGPNSSMPENYDRFEGLPPLPMTGMPVEVRLPAERRGDVFRIERAPTRTDIRLVARVDHEEIASIRLEPLTAGETREIPLAVDNGIVVPVRCVDAVSRQGIDLNGLPSYPQPNVRWSGARPRDHARRTIYPDVLDGSLVLPGPGHVEIEGAFEGYAPFRFGADVDEGTPIEIPLTRWRKLFVKVKDAHGEPWKNLSRSSEIDATTRSTGFGFLASGRAPNCVVVAASAPLPSELDPDAPVAAKLHPWFEHAAISGFLGSAPSEPLRVGIYDDGVLVGSADVPAIAPQVTDDPSAPSSKRAAEIAVEARHGAGSADALQTVTVEVVLPPPSDGALRFRAVDRESGEPFATYQLWFEPIVLDDLVADGGENNFKVGNRVDGLFTLSAIPAGKWRMRICRGSNRVDDWVGPITIDAGRTTDLGTLTVGMPGRLAVHVVDETGERAVDAEIRVTSVDGKRPLEFWHDVGGFARQTSVRTTNRARDVELELACGKVRVEVRSEGYAPAFAEVDVPPAGKAACTITLKPIDPSDEPSASEKH